MLLLAHTGHRYYGPPSTDRRATSPNDLPHRNNSVISTGAYYSISESLSRPTSASRARAAPIDPEHDDHDAEGDGEGRSRASSRGRSGSRSRSRSRSRSMGRYATINGPPPPPGTFAPPPRATSAERGKEGNRRGRAQSENDVSGAHTGSNRELHRAIGQLEASRQSLYASTASSSHRNKQAGYNNKNNTNSANNSNIYYQSTGPVSLLKEAADAALQQELQYLNNGTYSEGANYGTHTEGAKVRRGSNASMASAMSNVSHLSVSTGSHSHSNAHKARLYPSQLSEYAQNTDNTDNRYDNSGLKRSPPRSAASHRLGNMRRPSGATESTDANYSGTRYSDYRFDDLHSTTGANAVPGSSTGPALYREEYDSNNNNTAHTRTKANNNYRVSGSNSIRSISNTRNPNNTNNTNPNQTTVRMYAPQPVSYATYDNSSVSSGANANTDNVIKGIRRPPPYYNTINTISTNATNTITSPNANVDRSHISSSGSDTDDSVEQRNTEHNTTLNGTNSTNKNVYRGSGAGKSNAKIFTFQNAVGYEANPSANPSSNPRASPNTATTNAVPQSDYAEDYYNTQYAPATRTTTLKHVTNNTTTNNKNKPQSVPGWTLSKYKTNADTGSPTSGNRGRSSSGHVQSNAQSGGGGSGGAGGSGSNNTPQLYVYRGRPADTVNTAATTEANPNPNTGASVLLSPTTTKTKRASSTTGMRRGTTPKVPVPIVVEYASNREAGPFQNATQADMASYIESMRKMRY